MGHPRADPAQLRAVRALRHAALPGFARHHPGLQPVGARQPQDDLRPQRGGRASRVPGHRPRGSRRDPGAHLWRPRRLAHTGGTMAEETTTYTLDQFLADTRATIKAKGVPSGLAEIRDHLEKLLRNPELLKKHLGDPVPYKERTTIGHDPETDVHVLVHGREKAGQSSVHDHGPCWVIYGNYKNPTRMRRCRRLDDGQTPGHAEVVLQRECRNEPGHASVFAGGDIHSIEFGDDTFFIRVTGGDVETKEPLRFDVEQKTVTVANRALGQR